MYYFCKLSNKRHKRIKVVSHCFIESVQCLHCTDGWRKKNRERERNKWKKKLKRNVKRENMKITFIIKKLKTTWFQKYIVCTLCLHKKRNGCTWRYRVPTPHKCVSSLPFFAPSQHSSIYSPTHAPLLFQLATHSFSASLSLSLLRCYLNSKISFKTSTTHCFLSTGN